MKYAANLMMKNGKNVCAKTKQPMNSNITGNSDVVEIARVLDKEEVFDSLYLIDENAIQFDNPSYQIYNRISACTAKVHLRVEAAADSIEDVEKSLAAGASSVVLGTLATEGSSFFLKAIGLFGPGKIVPHIHIFERKLLAPKSESLRRMAPKLFAKELETLGYSFVVIEDMGRVGNYCSPDLTFIKELTSSIEIPVEVVGGISKMCDIEGLSRVGATRVNIGRALHEGLITISMIRNLSEDGRLLK
jgi:phosphoribosylformimino-5-aminoimidazole carboxamide ribonucleotide (ProFAR) isomerase